MAATVTLVLQQVEEAVGTSKTQFELQLTVLLLEQMTSREDGLRVTATLNVQVLVPHAFVAVQVTTVVPTGKTLPLAGVTLWSVPPVTTGPGKFTRTPLPQMLVVML